MFDISEYLKEFRCSRGLSYANLSREYFDGELSPQTLKNLETGLGEPRISTLMIVSEKLGVGLHRLAHSAFGLPDPEEMGELEGLLGELIALAARMDEEERRLLLSFTRFILEGSDAEVSRERRRPGAAPGRLSRQARRWTRTSRNTS